MLQEVAFASSKMLCVWVPAAQALAVLLLISFVCGGDLSKYDDPQQFHGHIGSFKTISVRGYRTPYPFCHNTAASRMLEAVPCAVTQSNRKVFEVALGSFWMCADRSLRVAIPWVGESVYLLRKLLQTRGQWDGPAMLSISQNSWSAMDASDLATLFQENENEPLPRSAAYLSSREDGRDVSEMVSGMVRKASSLAMERLHIELIRRDYNYVYDRLEDDARNRGYTSYSSLSDSQFALLATALLTAPNLRDLSISLSWDSASLAESIAMRLSKSTSARKLSVMRTIRHDGSKDPLSAFTSAALTPAANANGGWRALVPFTRVASDSGSGRWRALEHLSIITRDRRCQRVSRTIGELEALQSLAEQMPALRHVHLEHGDRSRCFRGVRTPNDEGIPALGDILHRVRNVASIVSATLKTDSIGVAGVVDTSKLAQLSDCSVKGHAAVASASNLRLLIGQELLLKTTALTIVSSFPSRDFTDTLAKAGYEAFEVPVDFLPELDRLAVDSRWTGDFCNHILVGVPAEIGTRLRVLMVHTLQLSMHGGELRALQGLLQAGPDISVVELGISIPSTMTTEATERLQSLAAALSDMPSLAHVTLTLTDESDDRDNGWVEALYARFQRDLPSHVTVVKGATHPLPNDQQIDGYGDPVGWRLGLTTLVQPNPAFPSPLLFHETV